MSDQGGSGPAAPAQADGATPAWVLETEPLARRALQEIADDEQIGSLEAVEPTSDGPYLLSFAADVRGYPGWVWTAAVARVSPHPATVLEVALLPGAGALVAPKWVPWSQRFAEFRERRAADLRSRRALRTARAQPDDERAADEPAQEPDGAAETAADASAQGEE